MDERLIPSVNIGVLGHVSHGKTTLVEALTGKKTLMHSEELKRGITIRLGYADATIYECKSCKKFCTSEKCPNCFLEAEPRRTISFVDVPGHEALMATVLTGTGLMDGAIFVIAANEKCPQPQTREHLIALEVAGIKNTFIVQNKIDLVNEDKALENYEEIKNFVKGTILENSPIIPISAQQRINIDKVLEAIEKFVPTPERKKEENPKMWVARSFDINKPGISPKKLVGGVIGGSIAKGVFRKEDKIKILPGISRNGKFRELTTKIVSLRKGKFALEEVGPGGLVGVLTLLDPFLTKSDSLSGNLVCLEGKEIQPSTEIETKVNLLERVVGEVELRRVEPLRVGEKILINLGTLKSLGIIKEVKEDRIKARLIVPLYAEAGERASISRLISNKWRLIGWSSL